jgi:uncharacterized protein (TIGR02453 family)
MFEGFSKETLEFLSNLKVNNNKAWFEDNKKNYQKYLLTPFQELATDLSPFMLSINQDFGIDTKKIISRIYRDIRFSKNKSPYRYNMWMTFKRIYQDWKTEPSYFFEIFPDFYHYGMGFYKIPGESMNELRRQIIEKDEKFMQINSLYKKQKIFMIAGEKYKRTLDNSLSDSIKEWYQRKSIFFVCKKDIDNNFFSKNLLNDLMHDFKLIAPIYDYFLKLRGKINIYDNSIKKELKIKYLR